MTDITPSPDDYALKSAVLGDIPPPQLPYRPPMPRNYRPRIGIIGTGGIVACHLDAYRTAGWEVAAICNRTRAKAQARAQEFAPDAFVTEHYEEVLADPGIDVVDITLHAAERLPMIEAALRAGKHVLSQKPLVTALSDGERLVQMARDKGLKLAVNQNGRWAPHLAWMRAAVEAGLVGEIIGVHAQVHWNHGWIANTAFETMEDVILQDFGIHWFDFVASIIGNRAQTIIATATHARDQKAAVPLLAQALIRFEGGQASLVFDGLTQVGPWDMTFIAGTEGSLRSTGPDLGRQSVTLTTMSGRATPELAGTWFNDGFRGTMGALLVAIEDDAEPANGAAENLRSLALAFAAVHSRRTGKEVPVGAATRLRD